MPPPRPAESLSRLLLLVAWFGFMASASYWLPAYQGDLGGEADSFIPFYAVVAILGAVGVRRRADSVRQALVSTLPAIGIIAGAALVGIVWDAGYEYRGAPLYLYFGISLCASWALLMAVTALVSRTRWNTAMGFVTGSAVALLGLFFFSAQID